jgi:broad specificity phosphatase PhoE
MELWLIRHGEIDSIYNAYDPEKKTANPPLSEKGVRQAEALAEHCRAVRFERIVSSDLKRALRTAQILAAGRDIPVEINPAFREIDMGALYRGARWSDYPKLRRAWLRHEVDLPYPEGENGADVWARCSGPLAALTEGPGERVALVCHGGTIRSIVCGMLGIPQQKRHYLGEPLMNCSVSVIAINDGVARLHTFNEHAHLESLS